MKNLTALILAAGIGKRFWPLTTAKVLFPFMGKAFFEWAIGNVLPSEVKKAVIVVGPHNEKDFSTLKLSVPHKIVIQKHPRGMADAIVTAEREIRDASLLVINGDDIHDPSVYEGVINQAKSSQAFGIVPAYKTDTYQDIGYLVLDRGRIQKIVEKPGAGNEPSHFVFMVSYFVRESNVLLEKMKQTHSDKDDVHELALSRLMKANRFEMYVYEGGFASLKYPWHVLDVMNLLLKNLKAHRGSNVILKDNVIIEGNVVIADNVTIYENTKIIGPCYIGRNTMIGNNNMIRESHIGANCVTGFNTDITRSYVGDDCWFHNNYIGDSILEANISMGSGTKLANLRLDEGEISSVIGNERVKTYRNKLGAMIGKDVHIGVNTSIMPGIKIGQRSFVGAGVLLDRDLPQESFSTSKSELVIKKNTRRVIQKSRADFREKVKKYV